MEKSQKKTNAARPQEDKCQVTRESQENCTRYVIKDFITIVMKSFNDRRNTGSLFRSLIYKIRSFFSILDSRPVLTMSTP